MAKVRHRSAGLDILEAREGMGGCWKALSVVATFIGLLADGLAIYAFVTSGAISVNLPNLKIHISISTDGLAAFNLLIGISIIFFLRARYDLECLEICAPALPFILFSCAVWGLIPGVVVETPASKGGLISDSVSRLVDFMVSFQHPAAALLLWFLLLFVCILVILKVLAWLGIILE